MSGRVFRIGRYVNGLKVVNQACVGWRNSKYSIGMNRKGEKDFDKAKAYAKDKFDELQNGRKDRFHIEDITSVNVFYTKRDESDI